MVQAAPGGEALEFWAKSAGDTQSVARRVSKARGGPGVCTAFEAGIGEVRHVHAIRHGGPTGIRYLGHFFTGEIRAIGTFLNGALDSDGNGRYDSYIDMNGLMNPFGSASTPFFDANFGVTREM